MTNAIFSKLIVGVASLGALFSTVFFVPEAINTQAQVQIPSATILARSPISQSIKINEKHIFEGEINRRGLAVGYHHRANGKDSASARLEKIISNPNAQGLYVGKVQIRNSSNGQWLSKSAPSSFSPIAGRAIKFYQKFAELLLMHLIHRLNLGKGHLPVGLESLAITIAAPTRSIPLIQFTVDD